MYTFFVAINKDKWNALPDDIKKIIEETSEEWVDRVGGCEHAPGGLRWINYFKQQGGQMVAMPEAEITKMQKAVEPVIQNYIKDMEGKGFKRAEMEAQLAYIRERIAYWGKQETDRKRKSP